MRYASEKSCTHKKKKKSASVSYRVWWTRNEQHKAYHTANPIPADNRFSCLSHKVCGSAGSGVDHTNEESRLSNVEHG